MADESFDFSEIDQLAANLADVPREAGPNIRKAITVTSIKTKKDWQEPLKGSASLPALPYAITFDITTSRGSGSSVIKSEIGFDKERNQGALGNISEYGTPQTTGRGYGLRALQLNQDDFEAGIAIAIEQAEKKAGLA